MPKGQDERPAVAKPKSPTEAGSLASLMKHLSMISAIFYSSHMAAKIQRLMIVNGCWTSSNSSRNIWTRSGADAKHEGHDKLAVIGLALWDLDGGITHPMFKAKKLEHGAPDNTDIWRSRTTLAIAFDYLMAAGVPSRDASKKISKTPGIEKLLIKGAKAETSLINWRTRLSEGTVANELALEQWDWSRKFIEGLTGPPSDKHKKLKAEADRLIAVATKLIGKI